MKNLSKEFNKNFIPIESGYVGVNVASKYKKQNASESLKFFIRQREKELLDEVTDLLDEFNEMDDNAIQYEVRVRKPVEFFTKLRKLLNE